VLGAGLLLVLGGVGAAQDDSIAAAAAASKKAAGSHQKVYGDDDVTTLRHKDHVPDATQAAICDAACQDKVKDLLEREAPGKWQSNFDDAMAAMKDDDSWQELFARVKAQNCADRRSKSQSNNPALVTDLRSKVAQERQALMDLRREAAALPPNSPDLEGKLNLIRVRAVKLVIMGVELASLRSDSCTDAKPAAQQP
jgi:hypothetical protein